MYINLINDLKKEYESLGLIKRKCTKNKPENNSKYKGKTWNQVKHC